MFAPYLFALAIVGDPASKPHQVADQPAKVLADRVLAARRAIRSYEVAFRRRAREEGPGFDKPQYSDAMMSVWSVGDKHRVDIVWGEGNVNPENRGKRKVVCRNCERDGHTAMLWVRKTSVEFFPNTGPKAQSWPELNDLRGLGLMNDSYYRFHLYNLEYFLYSPMFSGHVESAGEWAGKPCRVIGAAHVRSKVPFRVYVRPDLGNSVVRIEATGTDRSRNLPFTYTTDCDAIRDEESGVWFPRHVRHIRTVGGTVEADETIDITAVKFNQPIPPMMFTVAGMDLPDGTAVGYPEIPRTSDWPTLKNGVPDKAESVGKVNRDIRSVAPPQPQPADTPAESARVWYAAAAVLFAIVGIATAVRLIRRSRAVP
jgi:hypothetical protein